MQRSTVLMLFGGKSSEHDVSIVSARNVYAAMDNTKYDVKLCYIDRKGKWWLLHQWTDNLENHGGVQLGAALGSRSFITIPDNQIVHPQVIFPVLHGKNGEDGTVQGLFELMEIPYVGCDVESSALCMDKQRQKELLATHTIPMARWMMFAAHENITEKLAERASELRTELGEGPWFVKPSRAGSSVGVSKVASFDGLEAAITKALEHDSVAIVEQPIVGRELEVAVLGNPPHHKASGVGEIIPGADFYDYDDKYASDSKSEVQLEADMPEESKERIRQMACDVYAILGCRGLARVDFLMDEAGNPYLNEVNTLPGFTSISMYPKLWHEQGMKYPALIDALIHAAQE